MDRHERNQDSACECYQTQFEYQPLHTACRNLDNEMVYADKVVERDVVLFPYDVCHGNEHSDFHVDSDVDGVDRIQNVF